MSYVTIEVEIKDGQVVPREPERLPRKGKGLLTVTEPSQETANKTLSPLEAFELLQQHLKLDQKKADEWMETIRNARR